MAGAVVEEPTYAPAKREAASSERAARQAKAAKMFDYVGGYPPNPQGMLTKEEADALDAELTHRVCIRERVL